jgi:hypothetical protein
MFSYSRLRLITFGLGCFGAACSASDDVGAPAEAVQEGTPAEAVRETSEAVSSCFDDSFGIAACGLSEESTPSGYGTECLGRWALLGTLPYRITWLNPHARWTSAQPASKMACEWSHMKVEVVVWDVNNKKTNLGTQTWDGVWTSNKCQFVRQESPIRVPLFYGYGATLLYGQAYRSTPGGKEFKQFSFGYVSDGC